MNQTNCEKLIHSNIAVLRTAATVRAPLALNKMMDCLSRLLRTQFVAWAQVRYKAIYSTDEIAFHSDIAFTEAILLLKKKVAEGELYDSSATVKTVLFEFGRFTLMAVLKTAVREKAKKARFYKHWVNDMQEPDLVAIEENLARVQTALQLLTEEERQIVVWRHLDQKKNDEIAALLAITTASATNKIYRCMEKLRTLAQKQSEQ